MLIYKSYSINIWGELYFADPCILRIYFLPSIFIFQIFFVVVFGGLNFAIDNITNISRGLNFADRKFRRKGQNRRNPQNIICVKINPLKDSMNAYFAIVKRCYRLPL